jgi:hypothetical protein
MSLGSQGMPVRIPDVISDPGVPTYFSDNGNGTRLVLDLTFMSPAATHMVHNWRIYTDSTSGSPTTVSSQCPLAPLWTPLRK